MNKSFERISYNRPRITQYNKGKNSHKKTRVINLYKKILKQIGICIFIVLLVILIKNIDSPITNKTGEMIKVSLKYEVDFKNSVKQVIKYVKEIPKIPDKVINVFSNFGSMENKQIKYIPPLNGEIISTYGENMDPILKTKTFQRGVDISGAVDQRVVTVGEGVIIEVGKGDSLGKYVKVQHEENIFSLYGNCSEIIVQKGQRVKQGEKIAIIQQQSNDEAFLHFELWIDGKVVDPMEYVAFDKRVL